MCLFHPPVGFFFFAYPQCICPPLRDLVRRFFFFFFSRLPLQDLEEELELDRRRVSEAEGVAKRAEEELAVAKERLLLQEDELQNRAGTSDPRKSPLSPLTARPWALRVYPSDVHPARRSRGAAEPPRLRGVRVRRSGGAEEPGEPSAEQEQRAGATEQRPKQRPRPADPPGPRNKF